MEFSVADLTTKRGDTFLVEEIYALINGWDDQEHPPVGWTGPCVMDLDPALADRLNYSLTEAFERFAPQVELAFAWGRICESTIIEDRDRDAAVQEYLAGAAERHIERLTARSVRYRAGSGYDA